jgi:DNA-binding response OmpR family regulator
MNERILIVEDDAAIALGLEDDLSMEGYHVSVVSDGIEGAEKAIDEAFDLVILDLMLPGKSGYDVCREIRRKQPSLPVLMLTARSQEAEKVLGLEMGADDYVTKPFSPLELRARIKALLRRSNVTGRVRTIGRLSVDLDRYVATVDGGDIELTPIELRLLVALDENRGRALTRDEILTRVWGESVIVSDRTVDTHVANLRAKIRAAGVEISSVRGVGYRVDLRSG